MELQDQAIEAFLSTPAPPPASVDRTTTGPEFEAIIHSFDLGLQPGSPEFQAAVILYASSIRGTHTDNLARWLGYPRSFVRTIARRLRENGIWKNGKVYVDWASDDKDAIFHFLLDLQVALGQLARVSEGPTFTLEELKALHQEINNFRRDSYSSRGYWTKGRNLTVEEWEKIKASLQPLGLLAVLRSASWSFKLAIDVIKPGEYPGAPHEGILMVHQEALPEALVPLGAPQGDDAYDPRASWNATWDLFTEICFEEGNKQRVEFCGINMPESKRAYEY